MSSHVLARFAPSPTGHLHVGNARVAMLNWLLCRHLGGRFLLRLDDTDPERSKDEYAQGIERDLAWLGLTYDDKVRQQDRQPLYDAAAEKLKADGRLYACYETPEELEYARRRQRTAGKPPIYDRSALNLSDQDKAALEAEGRKPHWRFKLNQSEVVWQDMVRGECRYNTASLSDPVLIRSDGSHLYTLPSVVDDLELGITHVLRGEDHVTNTAAQIEVFMALGGAHPIFAHTPLMTAADGGPLSKRLGGSSLADFREQGVEPIALAALLARIGTSEAVEPADSLDELVAEFDLGRLGRGSPRFDEIALGRLNAHVLHNMSFAEAEPRFAALGAQGAATVDEAFWLAVRENLERFDDVKTWLAVAFGDITPAIDDEDADFCKQAAALLPAAPWQGDVYSEWLAAIKTASGRKGRGLFMPLRKALTGMDHGPDLKALLPFIGYEKALKRLSA